MGSQPTVELFDVGMNRNGIHISATVFITEPGVVEPEDSYARIRKVTFVNDRVDKKEALKRDGTWVVVPEGEIYPEETHLPLMLINHQRGSPKRNSLCLKDSMVLLRPFLHQTMSHKVL